MQYLTNDDLTSLSNEPHEKINMIMAGMTALMDDTNQKVSLLENQPWFERMCNTVSGKNKMTNAHKGLSPLHRQTLSKGSNLYYESLFVPVRNISV